MLNNTSYGSTPIDQNEAEGLIPVHITTMEELNRWEYENILSAEKSVFSRKQANVLTEKYLKNLHKKMFSQVWKWAGTYRKSNKNIGVEWYHVSSSVKDLLLDTEIWVKCHSYSDVELAVRFHHRLVLIHPFPNGNGRHSRMLTDIILVNILNHPRFTWGSRRLEENSAIRTEYIQSLREADNGEFVRLINFVVS
jgi:Fic-DOC domain mobile mystery protein B